MGDTFRPKAGCDGCTFTFVDLQENKNSADAREVLGQMDRTPGANGGRNKIFIISLFIIILVLFSAYLRRPFEGEGFFNSDATYHVLLTMQAYDETPSSVHHWLPINTFGAEYNKFINNGPSLLYDELGNSYYVSFSPIGFYTPYFFCKLFHLDLSIESLYIFNCLLLFVSAIITGLIVYHLLKIDTIAVISIICYLFLPEILYTQGIVYWNHSLSQVFLLLQTLLFVLIFIEKKNNISFIIIFFIVSFIYPYSEWTGFISNIGMALGILLMDFRVENENQTKRCSVSVKSILYIMSLAIITVCALVYYILRFSCIASVDDVINTMRSRADARSSASFSVLMDGYKNSYISILIVIVAIFLILFILKKTREELKRFFSKKEIWIVMLVVCFPLLENFIMRAHAISYTFDRLKASTILILLLSIGMYILRNVTKKIYIIIAVGSVMMLVIWGLSSYSTGKIIHMDEYSDSIAMKDYLDENYLDSGESILVKQGWRAWGYLQTFYHRNIYCTALYTDEMLNEIATKSNYKYIIELESTSGFGDTACYTKAIVINVETSEFYQVNVINGVVNSSLITEVYAAELTDDKWTNGILNSNSSEILFENTSYNYAKLKEAKKIFCCEEEFKVLSIDSDSTWIHVYVDRDATKCAYPSALTVE